MILGRDDPNALPPGRAHLGLHRHRDCASAGSSGPRNGDKSGLGAGATERAGDGEIAIGCFERALRLSPLDIFLVVTFWTASAGAICSSDATGRPRRRCGGRWAEKAFRAAQPKCTLLVREIGSSRRRATRGVRLLALGA